MDLSSMLVMLVVLFIFGLVVLIEATTRSSRERISSFIQNHVTRRYENLT